MGISLRAGSVGQVLAALVGQDIVARSISLTQAAASIAMQLVTGARLKLGGGTNDYFTSDGADTIIAAGTVRSVLDMEVTQGRALYFNGATRSIGVSTDGTDLKVIGAAPLTPNADQGINLGKTTTRWSNGYFGGDVVVGMGSATAANSPTSNGKLSVNTTAVGNVGGAGPDDLMTYSLPASALTSTGRGIRVKAWGTTANNANAKTVALLFGTATLETKQLTVNVAGTWKFEAVIFRTGLSAQDFYAEATNDNGTTLATADGATVQRQATFGTATETETGAIVVKVQATASTADDDIVQQGMLVEYI